MNNNYTNYFLMNKVIKFFIFLIYLTTTFLTILSFAYILVNIKNSNVGLNLLNALSIGMMCIIGVYYFTKKNAKQDEFFIDNSSIKSNKTFAFTFIVRIMILIIAILFITLGIIQGELNDVISKAVIICSECIGLG